MYVKPNKKKNGSLSDRWRYSESSTNNSNNKGSQCLANRSSPPNIYRVNLCICIILALVLTIYRLYERNRKAIEACQINFDKDVYKSVSWTEIRVNERKSNYKAILANGQLIFSCKFKI